MESVRDRKTTVVLFSGICLFAVSSWVDINGLWTEIPLLVNSLPEGWNLPSYLVVIIQIANVAPLSYLVIKKLKPGIVREWIAVCVIIGIGIVSSFLLIFTWNKTSVVSGQQHSTALLALSFFLATVDCTSSVVYLPYMARFKSPSYMTALYVGEGLSGLIPALIGLAQVSGTENISDGGKSWSAGDNATATNDTTTASAADGGSWGNQPSPRFSVSVFFVILTIMLIASLVAFLLVHFHPRFDAFKTCEENRTGEEEEEEANDGRRHGYDNPLETRDSEEEEREKEKKEEGERERRNGSGEGSKDRSTPSLSTSMASILPSSSVEGAGDRPEDDAGPRASLWRLAFLYCLVTLINALSNGVLPSLQSFACLPYGYLTYDLAVKLSIVANPLACFLTLCLATRSLAAISVVAAVGTALSAYQIFLAALSPDPILREGAAGIVLAILSSVLLSACFSYAKVCISTVLSETGGERLLLYCGVFTQVGSLVGAVITFVLVNVYHVFKSS